MASDLIINDILKQHVSGFGFNVITASGPNKKQNFPQLLPGTPPPHYIIVRLAFIPHQATNQPFAKRAL